MALSETGEGYFIRASPEGGMVEPKGGKGSNPAACFPTIAKRIAPSVRENRDRDPGQIHLRGVAQRVYFGKK